MNIRDKLTVITGAMGFIGSNLVRYYNRLGHNNIIIIDECGEAQSWRNLLTLIYKQIVSKQKAVEFIRCHIDQIGSIIHLGAISDTTCTDGSLIMENNYQFSIDLASIAIDHDIPFLYASSAATYGGGQLGFDDDHEGLHSLKPLNLYGFSKHAFDLWLYENGHLDKVTGVKYFNIFGPHEAHKGRMASMVYHMTNQIQKEGSIKLFASNHKDFADGEQQRDFFYVKDAVKMSAYLIHHGLKGIYNVGSGRAQSWNTMAQHVFKALGKEVNINYIPMPRDLAGKYQNFTQANMDKFYRCIEENKIDFSLDYTFESAIFDYVQNYLQLDKGLVSSTH